MAHNGIGCAKSARSTDGMAYKAMVSTNREGARPFIRGSDVMRMITAVMWGTPTCPKEITAVGYVRNLTNGTMYQETNPLAEMDAKSTKDALCD